MDGFSHAASISDVLQVLALKCDRVVGYYGLLGIALLLETTEFARQLRVRPGSPDRSKFALLLSELSAYNQIVSNGSLSWLCQFRGVNQCAEEGVLK